MTDISCDNISKSFGVENVLSSVSFALNTGDKMGIVGVNGAGKSTLFGIITGKYNQDDGNVFVSKDKSVGILEQENVFNEENSLLFEAMLSKEDFLKREAELEMMLREIENGDNSNVERYTFLQEKFTEDGGYEFRGRVKGTLINMGFSEDMWNTPVKKLSGGQKTRLALVRLILREPDIMLLDEPTNHLDIQSVEWLEEYIKNYKKTVLIISHDRYFLDMCVNKILEIEYGKGKLYNGNYSKYITQKENDREIQEKHYKNQQKEIARIEAYIEQQRRWNRERNIIAAESRQKMLDKMEKVEKPSVIPSSIKLKFADVSESGNDVLSVKNISKSFGSNTLFSDVSFEVKKRDHLFICGNNGCGKSTLIKIISGRLSRDKGQVEFGYNVKVGYYDQENQDLTLSNTVLDELWDCYPDLSQTEIRNALARFLFKGDDIIKTVSVLSGGEKARLTLCKLLLSKMNVLILDEPTNHLDIQSREALESALSEFDGTIIAVSHDRYFLSKLSTRILAFDSGTVFDFSGNYKEYQDYKNRQKTNIAYNSVRSVTQSKEDYIKNKKKQLRCEKGGKKVISNRE